MVRKRMPKHPLTIAKTAIIFQRKGAMPIVRNSFIQMSKLPNVKGRISYIASKARQENLYAVYETIDRKFWTELARCNQEEFKKSGTEGTCIEARELIIALPESFVDYEPDRLLKLFTEHFRQNYGVECISALHHNKRKTNYHIHLIFSERKLLDEPVEKIATRNMFYDENGKHVRTKKEILDEAGQLRNGCKIIPKGEVYERNIFTIKDSRFKSDGFLDEVKRSYRDEKTFHSEYGVTTLAMDEKMFNLEATNNPSNWLGPVWLVANYAVFKGLLNYGYREEAEELCRNSLKLLGKDLEKTGCLHEYYNPFDGTPVMNGGFINWNVLALSMAKEIEKEDVHEKKSEKSF